MREMIAVEKDWLKVTPRERAAALSDALTLSVEGIARAAEIFAAMEEAGDDISHVSVGIAAMLRAIARRKMLPEVATQLKGSLRSRIGRLPLPIQKRVMEKPVELLVRVDGTTDVVRRDIRTLDKIEADRLIDRDGHVRTPEEQRIWSEREERKRLPSVPDVVCVDKRRGCLVIRQPVELTRRQLARYLAELSE